MCFTFVKFLIIYFPIEIEINLKLARFKRDIVIPITKVTDNSLRIICIIGVLSILINLYLLWTANLEDLSCLSFPSTSFFSSEVSPILTAVLNNYIPFISILTLNCAISIKIMRTKENVDKTIYKSNFAKNNITILLMTISFLYIILTAPTQTLNTIIYTKPELFKKPFYQFLRSFFTVLSKSYYCINFYVYLIINKEFRKTFCIIIHRIVCCCKNLYQ